MAVPAEAKLTFWERAAQTRWGTYLTSAERRVLLHAASITAGPAAALEIGCEGGRWSIMLHDLGWDLTCTDVDADMLKLCKQRLPEATCIHVSPGDETLPSAPAALRLLLVYEVAPVIQSNWFPREAARVLEPGGILVCAFYNALSARGIAYRAARFLARKRDTSAYYTGPSYGFFRRRLERLGFEISYEEGLGWFPFTRQSDSALVPLCASLEARLGLRSLPRLRPFVLLIARRELI